MSEQAVQVLQIVPGEDLDTAVGEQAHGLVSFVDADGNPVDVGGGGAEPVPEDRLLPTGGAAGQVPKKTADGVEWGADNSAPAAGTAAEIQAGTVTAARVWSPKVIHDEIARQIAAIPPAGG